ncbi:hypothetical protein Val02_75980 [Virgisporangium aliadipatigenens]|uniref:Endoglucanase n=1 Tax=Virgisporangium aliadipatigenens TaxID=741659 RepID=A0A8J4DW20_9ACTN|nr:cellulase family glycosylhydrolase [Virgisporangium aliadipatigenens]GIJ50712.1 hypothetical protein Val02_75980 [Virgisporangium aliadipatigenens]
MLSLVVAVTAAVPGVYIANAAEQPAVAAVPTKDWLHVQGNQIVDEANNPVWLTGTNWFGFNASERVFHGLWSANITTVTKSMADRGINMVRVPISTQLLLEWKAGTFGTVNVNTFANPELAGKNSLQVFDYWLGLCEQFGIKVMIDVHSAEADNAGHNYPVWYKGSITAELFYQGWEWITTRYRENDTIVAMDVKNEPHGSQSENPRAKWDGSTDPDNWKYVCETAGKRILAINPNLLILCEGIQVYPKSGVPWTSTGLTDYHNMWWGGNLRGVAEHPVNLGANQDQLVYSPHDYGPLVFDQPWFQGDFDKTSLTNDVWRPNWLYIHENNTAPLLIGEWGGRLGQDPRQDKWMFALRDLMIEKRIHHTFWVLNPNSGDTGGLLLDDWQTWDETKYAMLKPALWQHNGKFVALDHQVRLGGSGSTTGVNLADVYGGGTSSPSPAASSPRPSASSPRPSVSPSSSNGPVPTGALAVQYRNTDSAATDNQIRPHLRVANRGTSTVDLRTVTVRYYFTRDGASAVNAVCDWAQAGCANVSTRVVNLSSPVNGADAYLEVGFTAGSVAAGADTGDIQLRLNKADWSNFNEADDYSRAVQASYVDAARIPAYSGSTLVWGAAP